MAVAFDAVTFESVFRKRFLNFRGSPMRIKILERSKCVVTTLAFAGAAALTACGGGGVTGANLSGRVIDGYLTGAVVCLDVDSSKTCDAGEPTAVTKEGGNFVLNPPSGLDLSTVRLIVDVPPTAIDEDTNAAVGSAFQLTAPANLKVVTPLTTVALAYMDTGVTWEEAVDAVKLNLGIAGASFDVVGDYVASSNVSTHNVARVLAGVFKENQIQGSANLRNAVPKVRSDAFLAYQNTSPLTDADLQALVTSAAYATRQSVFASTYTRGGAWIQDLNVYKQGDADDGAIFGWGVSPDTNIWGETWSGPDPELSNDNFYWGSWNGVLPNLQYIESWVMKPAGFDISGMGTLNIKIWGNPEIAAAPRFTPILQAKSVDNCAPTAEYISPLEASSTATDFHLPLSSFQITESCGERVSNMTSFIDEKLEFVRVRIYNANLAPVAGINVGAISFEP